MKFHTELNYAEGISVKSRISPSMPEFRTILLEVFLYYFSLVEICITLKSFVTEVGGWLVAAARFQFK